MNEPLLRLANIETYYGPIMAIRGISLSVSEGSIVTVLGANGAGKSSLLKAIQGTERSAGRVVFDGVDISGWSAP